MVVCGKKYNIFVRKIIFLCVSIAIFSHRGTATITKIEGTMNAIKYYKKHMFPHFHEEMVPGTIFIHFATG